MGVGGDRNPFEMLSGITICTVCCASLFIGPYFYKMNQESITSYSSPFIGVMYTILLKIAELMLSSLGRDSKERTLKKER